MNKEQEKMTFGVKKEVRDALESLNESSRASLRRDLEGDGTGNDVWWLVDTKGAASSSCWPCITDFR